MLIHLKMSRKNSFVLELGAGNICEDLSEASIRCYLKTWIICWFVAARWCYKVSCWGTYQSTSFIGQIWRLLLTYHDHCRKVWGSSYLLPYCSRTLWVIIHPHLNSVVGHLTPWSNSGGHFDGSPENYTARRASRMRVQLVKPILQDMPWLWFS